MKVLQVCKYYSPFVGGIESVAKKYSEYFLSRGVNVTVVCVNDSFKFRTIKEDIDGVTVYRCSSFGTYFSMPISLSFFVYFLVNYFRCNAVIFHMPFPLADLCSIPALFVKRKIYSFWHSDIVKQKLLKIPFIPFNRKLLDFSEAVISTSPNLVSSSAELERCSYKCKIIPLSIDCGLYESIYRECPDSLLFDDIDFLFFGRLSYYKGINILLDSVQKLADIGVFPKVVIAGAGELRQYVLNWLSDYSHSNVSFIDRYVTEGEKAFLLDKSKFFLFPSIANSEAFGITQVEAMCFGVPVINTNLETGVPWVSIGDITGFTVEPGSSEELSHCMMLAMNLPQDRYNEMSLSAKERAIDMFDDVSVFKQLDEMFNLRRLQ